MQDSAKIVATYYVENSTASPDTLTVHVTRANSQTKTQLILRGLSMGIIQQVQNMTCDGQPMREEKSGLWQVPAGCKKLRWETPLVKGGEELASDQKSSKLGDFILFSEISSLPRLQDATSEYINIAIPSVKTTYPKADAQHTVPLPDKHAAPFFLLLNPTKIGSDSSGELNLTYLSDSPDSASKLPSLFEHMTGLQWLHAILPSKNRADFNIAWLGIHSQMVSLSGAAGADLMLANYPVDREYPFGKTMLLYVALHEAFHKLAEDYPSQPTWVAESLASYYGTRALQHALPNDANAVELTKKFIANAHQFNRGLISINKHVQDGDRSEYGAFYTKGVAFWTAVDDALRQAQHGSLDKHVHDILQTKFDENGYPVSLQNSLNLSPVVWQTLKQHFLD